MKQQKVIDALFGILVGSVLMGAIILVLLGVYSLAKQVF